MTQKISSEKTSRQRAGRRTTGAGKATQASSGAGRHHSSSSDHIAERQIASAKQQKFQRALPAPKSRWIVVAQQMLLSRAMAWFRGGQMPAKRLRVLDTVSLGEKRLVALIQADGGRFLVGCGATGVSLLTQLDKTQHAILGTGPTSTSVESVECR